MSQPLTCTVISPERTLFQGPAARVIAPGADGELGVLDMHAPLLARLGIGVVRIHGEGEDAELMAVRGGFLQVRKNEVKLLVTEALRPEDITPEDVRARHEEVVGRLQSPASDDDFRDLLAERRWLETQLQMTS